MLRGPSGVLFVAEPGELDERARLVFGAPGNVMGSLSHSSAGWAGH